MPNRGQVKNIIKKNHRDKSACHDGWLCEAKAQPNFFPPSRPSVVLPHWGRTMGDDSRTQVRPRWGLRIPA